MSSADGTNVGTLGFQAEGSESAAPFDLAFDSAGLGFSVRGGRVFVHYPKRDETGSKVYGGGFQIDYPFGAPDANEITRERVGIINTLAAQASPDPKEKA